MMDEAIKCVEELVDDEIKLTGLAIMKWVMEKQCLVKPESEVI